MRRNRGTIWITIVAGLAVLLAITNIVLAELNARAKAEVAARNQVIQQRLQLDALTRELVSAIATLAAQRNDEALRTVLTEHGITVNPPQGQSTAPAPALRR